MIHTDATVRTLQVVAAIVGFALLLWSTGFPMSSIFAEAANVTSFSDTLSDSHPSSASNHVIAFTIPNGISTGDDFTITLPGSFGMGSIVIGDVDLATGSPETDQTIAASAAADTWGVSGFGGNTLTFETPTNFGVPSSTPVVVRIGTNASGGTNQITNPSTVGSYEITVGGSMQDSGATRVAIVQNVVVTANVDTTFDFTVTGLATSSPVNGTSTSASSSPIAIPFATLTAGVIETLAQELSVSTNATNGFVVTVAQDNNLQSSTGADIDGFIDGAYTDTPTAWTDPSGNVSNEATWGHWGLTSDDTDLEGAGTDFGSDQWVAASTTARAIFAHDGPTLTTSGVGVGTTTVGYQVEITALQEAGDDYTTTLTYVATPTF